MLGTPSGGQNLLCANKIVSTMSTVYFIKLDPFQLQDTGILSQSLSPEIISTLNENRISYELEVNILVSAISKYIKNKVGFHFLEHVNGRNDTSLGPLRRNSLPWLPTLFLSSGAAKGNTHQVDSSQKSYQPCEKPPGYCWTNEIFPTSAFCSKISVEAIALQQLEGRIRTQLIGEERRPQNGEMVPGSR